MKNEKEPTKPDEANKREAEEFYVGLAEFMETAEYSAIIASITPPWPGPTLYT